MAKKKYTPPIDSVTEGPDVAGQIRRAQAKTVMALAEDQQALLDLAAENQLNLEKSIFNYLKDNLTISVDCFKDWGYYGEGDMSVKVTLSLHNPETDSYEVICCG